MVSLSRSVELTARWGRILAAGPLSPVTLDDLSAVRGLGGLVIFIVSFLMFIIVSVTSFMRSLCTVGMRPGGGGIGLERTPWCIRMSGFVLIWFPLLLFSSVSLILRMVVLGCLLIRLGLTRNSARPGFPIFVTLGQRDTSLEELKRKVEWWLPLLPEVDLPRLTGQMLADVVRRKGATAGSIDGWGWTELKVLPVSWYDELARILTKVEDVGVWPDGLLDAYIAMIPKTDGDATPLGQRPFSVLPVVYRILGFCSYGSA